MNDYSWAMDSGAEPHPMSYRGHDQERQLTTMCPLQTTFLVLLCMLKIMFCI